MQRLNILWKQIYQYSYNFMNQTKDLISFLNLKCIILNQNCSRYKIKGWWQSQCNYKVIFTCQILKLNDEWLYLDICWYIAARALCDSEPHPFESQETAVSFFFQLIIWYLNLLFVQQLLSETAHWQCWRRRRWKKTHTEKLFFASSKKKQFFLKHSVILVHLKQ